MWRQTFMTVMMYVSLALNVVVLVPVCAALASKSTAVQHAVTEAWGQQSAARGILLSIYSAILVASLALLMRPVSAAVFSLLAVQVLYKVTTPFTVGSVSNPVVISNLAVATVHIATLVAIGLGKPGRNY
jgi:hypothetical protein